MFRGCSKFFFGLCFGLRLVFVLWSGKGKKCKVMDIKFFWLIFVDGDGNFEDMWEILIDLFELQESYGLYIVVYVVVEIEWQFGEEDIKLVVIDIKGNFIRDMFVI